MCFANYERIVFYAYIDHFLTKFNDTVLMDSYCSCEPFPMNFYWNWDQKPIHFMLASRSEHNNQGVVIIMMKASWQWVPYSGAGHRSMIQMSSDSMCDTYVFKWSDKAKRITLKQIKKGDPLIIAKTHSHGHLL